MAFKKFTFWFGFISEIARKWHNKLQFLTWSYGHHWWTHLWFLIELNRITCSTYRYLYIAGFNYIESHNKWMIFSFFLFWSWNTNWQRSQPWFRQKKIGTSKIVFQLTVMIMICVRFHAINVMEMFGKWDKSHIIEIHTHTQISSMESISQVGNIFIYM